MNIDVNETIKNEAIQYFNCQYDEIKVIEKLLGGMSHLTYLIEVKKQFYTIRMIGEGGNLYVDRHEEKYNMDRIIPLDLNNETVYFNEITGTKIAKYVPGTVLTQLDFNPYLNQIAHALKKLHQSNITPLKNYGLIERLNRYESYLTSLDEKYLQLKAIWIDYYNRFYANCPQVFCHNDAQRSNMVITPEKLYLLDWEYAAANDFFYDIASFGNVRFEDAFALLDVYLGQEATKEEKNHVRFYRFFQALQWHVVAKHKHTLNLGEKLHLDFNYLADKYLELANRLYLEIKEDFDGYSGTIKTTQR